MNELTELYLKGITNPQRQAIARHALSREMRLNGCARATREEHALTLYSDGYRVRTVRDKVRLTAPNGTFFEERDVTKALCDFVVFLTELSNSHHNT